MNWKFRLALLLVPASWRASVRADIEEEARARGLGAWWHSWQAVRTGVRLRSTVSADVLATDLRYGIRSLWRSKGFTAAALLTLILGLGVNLAVFTVVDRMLFRPLPYRDSSRLVMVSPYQDGNRYSAFNRRLFVECRAGIKGITDMAFAGFTYGHVSGEGPGRISLYLTESSFNLLDVLGVAPVFGRGFLRDDAVSQRHVALITFETWQGRFGGSSAAIGTTVQFNETSRTIVGVLPRGFIPPVMNSSERFDGIFLVPDALEISGSGEAVDPGVARLAPGVSIAVAQQQFEALAAGLGAELQRDGKGLAPRVLLEPVRNGMFWRMSIYLWLLTLAASLVGLLACVNYASLLLARGRTREIDAAVRGALGASRARLMATEAAVSVTLCLVASGASLAVLYWLAASLRALVPATMRPFVVGAIDGRVVAIAVLAALITGIVSVIPPTWRASQTGLVAVLQHGAGGRSHGLRHRAGRTILVAEAALAVLLVAGAAIVVRSFVGLVTTDVGWKPEDLQVVRIQPTGDRRGGDDDAELARFQLILDVIRRQPGVAVAAAVDSMPAAGATARSGGRWGSGMNIGLWQMTDGFLATVGARIVAGQDITRGDVDQRNAVALVTRAAARRLWPGLTDSQVVGQSLTAPNQVPRRVIGVVADVHDRYGAPASPKVFAPVRPEGFWYLEFAVKATSEAFNLNSLRQVLAVEAGVTSVTASAAGSAFRSSLEQPQMQAIVFGTFAVSGLLLAAFGLFAIASFDVTARRYEMGLRLALGATAAGIRWFVVREALKPVAVGVAIGLVGAYWAAQFVQSLVYEIDARSLWTLAAVAATLLTAALIAAWLPARRASRVDPVTVLRAQ